MELINPRDLQIEKWTLQACKGIFFLLSIFSILCLVYFCFVKASPPVATAFCFPNADKETLGSGPLSLEAHACSLALQPLLQELILVGVNTRPDENHQLTFALRSSGERKNISIGEMVFLQEKEGAWSFSQEATPLALTPYSLENRLVLCKIIHNSTQTECTFFPSPVFSKSLQEESYVKSLREGLVWGTDVFLSAWGGDEYRELSKKMKISLGSDVVFLKIGDCLWWNGERWTEDSDTTSPVAELVKSSRGIEFQVWDEIGLSSEKILLSHQSSPEPRLDLGQLMTAVRPRSATEITCLLGKRRVIIKEGDWWIRTENRWKQIRTTADLEACLFHDISGELFLFETIEASKEKIVVKGHVFNPMRTTSSPILLVVQTENKRSSKASASSRFIAKSVSKKPPIAIKGNL